MFCLHELRHSHTKNVLLQFLRKKKDANIYEFVQNIVGRHVLLVLWTISYEIDKTASVERKAGSGRPRSVRTQRISRMFFSWIDMHYAVIMTVLFLAKVLAKSRSYPIHLLPCSAVKRIRSKNMRAFCYYVSTI